MWYKLHVTKPNIDRDTDDFTLLIERPSYYIKIGADRPGFGQSS